MPKKPSAQLDTLLRIRRRQEDAHARVLADARKDVRRAEEELASIEARQVETLDQAGKLARRQFDAQEVRLYYQYERHLARLADDTSEKAEELRQIAEQRRKELEEAMKRRRIMEKLIDRKIQIYMAELRREEQNLLDEIAGNRAAALRMRYPRPPKIGLALMPESTEAEAEQRT